MKGTIFTLTSTNKNIAQNEVQATNIKFTIDAETLCEMANYPIYIAQLDAHIFGIPLYSCDHEYFVLNLLQYY